MYSSDSAVKDNVDMDNNSPIRQTNTPPSFSNLSQSSSPSCSTLLVIDDNSNSEDSTIPNTNNIPTKPIPSTPAQTAHIPIPTSLSPPKHDIGNGTADQQRRRNSSIAKLLGGHPLNNQQYEEINQQILDAQSALIATNNSDNGPDIGIQRSRSSITRTLLMNLERTNSNTKLPPKTQTASPPSLPKDFEYLIRQELDTEHSPSTLLRNNSASKVFQNINSSSNVNAQSHTQTKLKRKRPMLKAPLSTSNVPPFSLHEPFELESSATNSSPTVHHSHSQNEFLRVDSSKRPRHSNQQQYNTPVNTSTTNQSPYPYSQMNINSSNYNQVNIQRDLVPSSNCSSSCNCSRYSHSTKLALTSPVTHLSSPATISNHNNSITMTATRKTKSMYTRSDVREPPRQRSYSNTFNQSDSSLAASSEPSVPLKKRLLHAYNNEQQPSTPL